MKKSHNDKATRSIRPTLISAILLFGVVTNSPADGDNPSFDTHTLSYADSVVAVHIDDRSMGVEPDHVIRWVRRAADAMVAYFGRYPVERVDVLVQASPGGRLGSGKAFFGRRIVINVGPDTRPADLDEDWRMTHEMVHLSFPDLDRRHIWMTEGVATYIEPIARARIGQMPAENVWWWMVSGLPKGLPEDGDQGLDRTHTWGRIYWGGALYFFLADMMIRQETNNERSIDDALRGILDAGGNGSAHWPVTRVIATGDQATGTTVMTDLYNDMAGASVTPDIQTWFENLGVHVRGEQITFNDNAPLAHLRRAVTDPAQEIAAKAAPTLLRSGKPVNPEM
jgi:hypothetical protein